MWFVEDRGIIREAKSIIQFIATIAVLGKEVMGSYFFFGVFFLVVFTLVLFFVDSFLAFPNGGPTETLAV